LYSLSLHTTLIFSTMKIIASVILLVAMGVASAQSIRPNDAYLAEENGYFSNLIPTGFGMIATSNNCNEIFLIADGQLKTLIAAPGCGRYMQLSPDGKTIGFKHISKNGLQCPALLDIETGEISFVAEPATLCGQPAFSSGGDMVVADTTGFAVYRKDGTTEHFTTHVYANYTAISPDGTLVVYNDNNDQLLMLNTTTKETVVVSPEGCALPAFSASGKYISFVASLQRILVFSIEQNTIIGTLYGSANRWHPTQDLLAFNELESENYTVKRSQIELFNPETGVQMTLAGGSEQQFFNPVFDKNGDIYFHDQTSLGIYKWVENTPKCIYRHSGKLPMRFFETDKSTTTIVTVPGTVPYVHQVYDTPTWHSGYWSCAPTTSAMAFAYYNRLPPWPTTVDHGMSWDPHVNNYGSYVADRYRFDEWYYSETALDASSGTSYGGYGYMWTGTYGPSSRMSTYLTQHYMTSNQIWTTSCTWAQTVAEIDNGYVHPICNYLTASGHLTLCIGYYDTQHSLLFNDPYGNRNDATYCDYDGAGVSYDWPGYNNGLANLGGTNSYVAWTVAARTTEPVYNDTIIDNNYYGHGFFMNNATLGSTMRYFRDFNTGYNGHTWFTLGMATSPDICYTTWEPTIPDTALYRVSVFIPSKGTNTTNAMYRITRVGADTTVTVNQATHKNTWVELGVFSMAPGAALVYLGDSTGTDGDSIAFDAVKFSKIPLPMAAFSANETQICPSDTVVFTSASQNSSTLQWFLNGGNIISQIGNQCTAVYLTSGQFDAILVAQNGNGSDTLVQLQYVNVGLNAISLFDVSDDTVFLSNPVVLFYNNSQNAVSYHWDFGDGSQSSDSNPYHMYSTTGSFDVALIANAAECKSDTSLRTIVVMLYEAIGEMNAQQLSLFPNPVGETLFLSRTFDVETEYEISDISGRLVETGMLPVGENSISTRQIAEGAYVLSVSNGEMVYRVLFVRK